MIGPIKSKRSAKKKEREKEVVDAQLLTHRDKNHSFDGDLMSKQS